MKTKFIFKDLTFCYIKEEDLESVSQMLTKESVCELVFFGPNTKEETLAYFSPLVQKIAHSITQNQIPTEYVFVIEKDKQFIGNCALLPIENSSENYLLGYTLDEPYWGKGYGRITGEFLVDYGFNILKARKITGDCQAENRGSKKIMESLGFQQEGCVRQFYSYRHKFSDNLLYGILK